MKKILIPVLLAFAAVTSCQSKAGHDPQKTEPDTLKSPQPKVDIRVNKEYDDQGNLVRMDSTYIWSYTNTRGDTFNIVADSLLGGFRPYSFNEFPDSTDVWLNPFFNYDSTFYTDFFHNNYFFDRWNKEFREMEHELHKLDSLRDAFLKRHYPEMVPKRRGQKL
ncbi:MAG: hypothetical protein GXO83_02790 [Chlorobi bacterium]|nr:hypothetical protein [Chlorobiota bacterium]